MHQQIRLSIKNFGPIKEGNFFIGKYTIFIGNQGTGKSTIAKLFSLFTWLEKALIRNIVTPKQLQQGNFNNKSYNEYYQINDYYKDDTFLEYEGLRYDFKYNNKKLSITVKVGETENIYKVMYVPAERNILSVLNKPTNIKEWPKTLASFLEAFEESKQHNKAYTLPMHDAPNFEYDKLNNISWIKGTNYRIRLTDASSGYQSLVPLCLVTEYLDKLVKENSNSELSLSDKMKLKKEVDNVMARNDLSNDVKDAMLQNISAKYKYAGFINIVEEMEQNLYPQSQKDILYFLLEKCNNMDTNKLLLTTHSPYLINYITLATKAFTIWQQIKSSNLANLLNDIVPQQSAIDISLLNIYELNADGTSNVLKQVNYIPSDDNLLNNFLGDTNDLYNDLLDIEEQCQA